MYAYTKKVDIWAFDFVDFSSESKYSSFWRYLLRLENARVDSECALRIAVSSANVIIFNSSLVFISVYMYIR